jgi:hypothetical protein
MKALEELADALRKALVARVEPNRQLDFSAADTLQSYTDVLCHTPHFLERPDRSAPAKKKQPILSAYNTSGHF